MRKAAHRKISLVVALLFVMLEGQTILLAQDAGVTLGLPILTNNKIQFTLSCQSNLPYFIESSADLRHWSLAATNSDPGVSRSITLPAPYGTCFFRARSPLPLFSAALTAVSSINLNGNNISADSFDSGDTNYSSPGGGYPVGNLSKTKDNGDVCADGVLIDSLNIGNAEIKGHVRTGPGTNTIDIGPNGSVGDRAWVEGGNIGIEPGWSSTDFNVIFPDVTFPSNFSPVTLLAISGGTNINGASYSYAVFASGDYSLSGFSQSIYFAPGVYARIIVFGTVSLTGTSQIHIASGAQVRWFQQGATFSAGGNGLINENLTADSFYYFGLASNTSASFGGNAAFSGAIYAPEAALTLGSGGNNVLDVVGASVTKTLRLNGHFNFHFDENLKRIGPWR